MTDATFMTKICRIFGKFLADLFQGRRFFVKKVASFFYEQFGITGLRIDRENLLDRFFSVEGDDVRNSKPNSDKPL